MIRKELTPEQKIEIGGIIREMWENGATDEEVFDEFVRYGRENCPLRSWTTFSFPSKG